MGNNEIPSSKIEVHQVVSGFGANMDLAEVNKLFSLFDAHGDGLITSFEFTRCLRAHRLDLSEEEEFANMMMKMDLHSDGYVNFDKFKINGLVSNEIMKPNQLWDSVITVKKMMGFEKPAKNVSTNVITKRKKY